MVSTLRWKHKLLDAFLKSASPEEIIPHVCRLKEEADELERVIAEPIEESVMQLLIEVRKDTTIISKAFSSQSKEQVDASSSSKKVTMNVKLPKLNINSFDGNELNWLSWWDQFSSTIHENPDLTDATRVQYLATALINEVKISTNQFPFVASSYSTIINYLKTTYGDIVKLRSIYANAITNMQTDNSVEGMRKNLDNLVAYLKHLKEFDPNQTVEHYLGHVLSKFTETVRNSAYLYLEIKDMETGLDNVLLALDRILKHQEKIKSLLRTINPQTTTETRLRQNVVLLTPNVPNVPTKRKFKEKSCIFCNKFHASKNCRMVHTDEGRRKVLNEKNLCWSCLKVGHNKKNCQQPIVCSFCKRKDHNAVLCYELIASLGEQKPHVYASSQSTSSKRTSKGIFLPTFSCFILYRNQYFELRGVLDPCAHSSYVNFDILQKFKLSGPRSTTSICSFASSLPQSFSSEKIIIRLFNKKKESHTVEFCSTPIIAASFDSAPDPEVCCNILPKNLSYADNSLFKTYRPNIDLLIGNDFYNLFVRSHGTKNITDNLVIIDTFFGYIPSGNLAGEPPMSSAVLLSAVSNESQKREENLNLDKISDMYRLEQLGINSKELDINDYLILQEYRKKQAYKDNRIVVSWPWKSENPKLNTNYRLALARLKSLFKTTSQEILNGVHKLIQEQIQTGILELAPKNTSYLKHYLPHRPLVQKNKIRIVNDASAHTMSNPSLNDLMHKGPSLINDLTGLLLRFRWKKVAISADIEKAFHQLVLQENDRDVVRIIWVKDVSLPLTDDNLIIYRYARVPFGVISAPFLLNIAIKDLFANDPVTKFDIIASNSFYVDNCVCSFANVAEAQSFYDQVMKRMNSVSFNLRDWLSNDLSFCKTIPKELSAEYSECSVLGLLWEPKVDSLSLKFELRNNVCWTKASVLSVIASIYDPLGWLSPCLLEAKVFMQKTWSLKPNQYNWSTPLPDCMQEEWKYLFRELKQLETFVIPRLLWSSSTIDKCTYELHVFADASKKAYSCVAYVVKRSLQHIESALIFSKLRLTPQKYSRLKELSIPRLELLGVLLATKIKTFLLEQLQPLNLQWHKVIIWTDASTVLQWLNSPIIQSIFVQNRLVEIRKHRNVEFRHVRTSHNCADLPTRGVSYKNLLRSDLWWHGPNWLVDQSQWPISPINVPNYIPKNCENVLLTLDVSVVDSLISDDFEKRFSCWPSYVRIFKIIISYCLLSSIGKHTCLSDSAQYQRAERCIFAILQHKYFAKELIELRNKNQPNPKLQYFIHTDGLIRCKGRLNTSSTLPFEVVCPILLPKSPLVSVLIGYIHCKHMHIGPEHTLSKVRERFWIIGARPFVKSVVHKCITCRRWEGGKFSLPAMPPLPSIRTVEVAPFIHTAVDLFGPLYILNDVNESVKCWVCIFVCLVTRAIHLEMVKDMSGNEFLLALSRFTSRRGLPKFILSDNGTNFRFVQPLVGPSNPVRISHFRLDQFLSSNAIQWSFIPALAPWFGGAYERLIRIVKSCLKKSFGFVSLNLVELQTVLCQAEDIINSRPISYVPSDVMQPLTPNHFLRTWKLQSKNFPSHLDICSLAGKRSIQHSNIIGRNFVRYIY